MANPTGKNQYTGGSGGKASKAQKIKSLENRLNALSPKAPLRIGVEITKQLRALGWGRK